MTRLHTPRSTTLLRALRVGLLACGLPWLTACGPIASGDFEGVSFSPSRHITAVVHTRAVDGTALEPAELSVLATAAGEAWPDADWGQYAQPARLALRRDLAMQDGVLLSGIPVNALGTAAPPPAQPGLAVQGPSAAVVHGTWARAHDPLPALAEVTRVFLKDPQLTDAQLTATLVIERAGDGAAGTVQMPFSVALEPEGRGARNIRLAAPVMQCAALPGPAARCTHAPRLYR